MKIINLLPKPRQKELHYEGVLHSLWVVVIISLISFAAVLLTQFGIKLDLQSQLVSLDGQISQVKGEVNKNDDSSIKTQIQQANGFIDGFNSLADSSPRWSHVLEAFVTLPPPGVKLNSLIADAQSKEISIQGVSPTRDLVIQLYNNLLAAGQDFYNVNYPLENIVQPTNDAFHFDFSARDNLFK